jgi:hypothetical protein
MVLTPFPIEINSQELRSAFTWQKQSDDAAILLYQWVKAKDADFVLSAAPS